MSNKGESSIVLGSDGVGENSAGSNPTENGSVGRKEQELGPEGTSQSSDCCPGCSEKSSSLEELRRELEFKDFKNSLLERE